MAVAHLQCFRNRLFNLSSVLLNIFVYYKFVEQFCNNHFKFLVQNPILCNYVSFVNARNSFSGQCKRAHFNKESAESDLWDCRAGCSMNQRQRRNFDRAGSGNH